MKNWALPFAFAVLLQQLWSSGNDAKAAEDLRMRPGISFDQDIDSGFPITASKMDDVSLAADRINFIFMAASGDLNSARQSKRVVDLYKRYGKDVKFIILDVDRPVNDDAAKLIKKYYKGYIPLTIILTASGAVDLNHTGEMEERLLRHHLDALAN